MLFNLVAIASLCAPLVATVSVPGLSRRGCSSETVISRETWENGVVLTKTKTKCHDERSVAKREDDFAKRQGYTMYLCPSATSCSTTCYAGSGGPNQNDCTAIQNAILNNGYDVQIAMETTWTYSWGSCEARFFNQAYEDITIDICPSAFAGTIEWLAGDCNGAHGAQGGKCLSDVLDPHNDPIWFIDVIHS